jgi:hypothetical protein
MARQTGEPMERSVRSELAVSSSKHGRAQHAQVQLTGLRDATPFDLPLADGRLLDAAHLGDGTGAAQLADHEAGVGVDRMLLLAHGRGEYRFPYSLASPDSGAAYKPCAASPMPAGPTLSGMDSLNARLRAAMSGPPKVTQAALAKACGVRQPSVSDWLSGRTRSLDSNHLIAASRFLRVSPEWLATGRGEMRSGEGRAKNSPSGLGGQSQNGRIDATTLGKAMKFAKAYLAARGELPEIENRPQLVLTAYDVIAEIEATAGEADFVEAMGRMARRLGVEHGDDRRATG